MIRRLSNGLELPDIGYGTYPMRDRLVESIPEAVKTGYRLIDTSDNYRNEEFVGRGLSECHDHGGEIVVVTKFSNPLKSRSLADCFENSRRKLGGRVDVYLLHWPYPFLWRDQWRRMEELYLSGRCRAIGVCNFERDALSRLLDVCKVRPIIDQFERHPLFQQRQTADFCRENGVQVMSYSPLARMDPLLMRNETLVRIAAAHGKSVGQVVLRWNLEHGDIPIPASGSEAHIRENFDIGGFRLSSDEVSEIDALEAGHRIRFDPAKRFTRTQCARFLWYRFKGLVRHD